MLGLLIKPIPVLLSIAWVLRARPLPSARYRYLLLVGLASGVVGDELLSLGNFIAGLLAFLVGHLFYATAFVLEGARPRLASFAGPILVALAAVAFIWPGLGALKIPVLFYVLAIASMAGLAIDRWRRQSPGAARRAAGRAAIGGCFFVASDALLSLAKFRGPIAPRWLIGLSILGTYYIAQGLIASSVGNGDQR